MITLKNRKGNILIVNDQNETSFILNRILQKEGYWVRFACNFTEAMDVLRKKAIDIVLTEMDMPNMNGIDLLKEIKKVKPEVPVVMMTDNGNIDSYLEAMYLGAFEYFNKPVKDKILCKAIEMAMETS